MDDAELRRLERLEDRANQSDKDVATLTANIASLNLTIIALTENLKTVGDSLQNLYITQSGSNTKVKLNEKIIWGVVAILGSTGLYLIQEIIKNSAGG